ncbi:response regulator transcription factor [Aliikangiella coralliicola]|uniref:Response regulator transcription factor n=1 Tax=Aliikangiella coralliicola TaxID=2592383 RepID=A0A545UEV6_9GAMM|nr:response regulator [Aliikangiella coralliicola]TQV87975.1 response regulator transcription factor [Aliikangiella coralliicola]
MKDLSIYIIDDEQTHADYTKLLVDSLNYPTEIYLSALEFLKNYDSLHPSVVISDVIMPDLTGLELLDKMKDWEYLPSVVFLTGFANVSMVKKALKQGAYDFVEKPIDAESFIKILHNAIEHASNQYQQYSELLELNRKIGLLTEREKQIFDLLLSGVTNKEIESQLFISKRTIETHRLNILHKFDAANLTELMSQFIKHNKAI